MKLISTYFGTESNNPLCTRRFALHLSLLTSLQVAFCSNVFELGYNVKKETEYFVSL